MKIKEELLELLLFFNSNWEKYQTRLCLELSKKTIANINTHTIMGELTNLNNGKGGSLPFFTTSNVVWCSLAPNGLQLQKVVSSLQSWITPSYGWQDPDDGYKISDPNGDSFQKAIHKIAPQNYFRWKTNYQCYPLIEGKLLTRYLLEQNCPERKLVRRQSLYELRTQFQTALIIGDRIKAENAITMIDTYELDKALNTQMMYIRLWHHFREFECIREFRNLSFIQAQPSLPDVIRECIKEAMGEGRDDAPEETNIIEIEATIYDWDHWFNCLFGHEDDEYLKIWLIEKRPCSLEEINIDQIKSYSKLWDEIYLTDELRKRRKSYISESLAMFIGDFVREPGFPRNQLAELYLSLLRLWGQLHAGINTGREEGHVLLELTGALFQLNHEIDEAKAFVEDWWRKRPVPEQLPFALDAIELLTFQHPDIDSAFNLWVDAGDKAKRFPEKILESEKVLWRKAGTRINIEEETIHEYFPFDAKKIQEDPLSSRGLQKIAIVCMREQQAKEAADTIHHRTNAEITIVSTKVAGNQTQKALLCDVVLFVWIATTHAVFRAFDNFDRKRLCYVQGTGSASIVRSLERWCSNELL